MAKKEGKKDACYHKVKSRYSVWPSAYASGALVKCRKVGAKNWGTKSEDMEFYNLISDYLIEEGFAYDENSVDDVILKLDESLLIQIYERKMTKSEKKKETKLKGKYDDSAMKQNMINQYGKEEGEKIYFATIRKQAMGEGVNFNHPIDPNRKTRTERDKKIEDAADSGQPNAPKILSKRGKGPSLPGRTQDMRKKALGEDKYSDLSKHAARMNLLNNPGPRSTPEETAEKKAKLEKKRGMKLDDHPQFKKEEVEHVDEAFPKVKGTLNPWEDPKTGKSKIKLIADPKTGKPKEITREEVDTRRAPAELVARLSAKREGEMAQDGPNKAAYDAKQRILKKAHEKMKKMKEEVELSEAPFQVYDMRDKVNVGKEMKNKKRARTKADKLDQEYGGYRYKVIPTGDDRPEVKYGTTKEEVEIGEELHPNVKKIDAISKQRVQQKAADAQRARERMASSTAAFQAHKKEVIAKGGTPVDALDSWQKKKMKKEEVEVKVEESTKLFYKLQAKGKGRSSTAKAQTTRDSNLEDQKSAKMRRQQAKQRQEREGDDKYGHPSLSAAERNPSMR